MSASPVIELDAVVLADSPLAHLRIAGLSARERAIRVAGRVGATRVYVIDDAATRAALVAWRGDRATPLLVIRGDQLVHTPLVQPMFATADASHASLVISVVRADAVATDLAANAYAGAFVARGAVAAAAITALVRGDRDAAFVATIAAPDVVRVPHGVVARYPLATPADRAAAHRLLYRILVKPQDNAITRYLYRPVSFPLTRLLAHTPITPNQISYVVALLVAIGCWLSAKASDNLVLAGTAIILAASYLDCCDGEIARLKLTSSRFGAWLDTIVDELSSVGYTIALGWHCHLALGPKYFGALPFDPWLVAIAISIVTYGVSIYCIYYNIIVGVGSANSQDYAGRFEVVPTGVPNEVTLRPIVQAIAPLRPLPPVLRWLATYAPYIVRRDFISWMSLALAALHVTQLSFAMLAVGGVATLTFVVPDHLKLRALRRSVTRSGQVLIAP